MRRGRFLYYIALGNYPNIGKPLPFGRFFSWDHANKFLEDRGFSHETHTIMCENGCPF